MSAKGLGAINTADLKRQLNVAAGAPAKPEPSPTDTGSRRPGRAHKTHLTVFVEFPVKDQLRMMTIKHRTTLQKLLDEALNDLFAKYGQPEIADTHER